MEKNYEILADSGSGHDTYIWNPRRADWVEMSKDDGEYTTFRDKAIAESYFESAKENCGYLKNVRIVEYEVEVEEE